VQQQVTTLADRIAENRVVAGLHYPADSGAGKTLAATLAGHIAVRRSQGPLAWLWNRALLERPQ
jgi:hypothetical protein